MKVEVKVEVKVEEVKVEEGKVEEVKLEEVMVEEITLEDVKVEEVIGEEVKARRNNFSLRQASTPSTPLPPISSNTILWRPWEGSCEATVASEWSG